MASIEERINSKGEKSYRVKVRKKGYPVQTASFTRKTDAKIWAQNTECAINEGRYFGYASAKKKSMSELIDRYIEEILPLKPASLYDQTYQLNYWKDKIGDLTIQDLTPSVITAVRNELKKGKVQGGKLRSNGTVNRYMAVLSHAFTIAMKEWEWVNDNPFMRVSKLKEARGRVRYLSEEERHRLLKACKESKKQHLYFIVVLAISTGARKNEILTLKWKDVHFDREVIILDKTKNGDIRSLPLQGYALNILLELFKHRSVYSELLFPSEDRHDKPVIIQRSWDNAVKEAELEDFMIYVIRRHHTSQWMAQVLQI